MTPYIKKALNYEGLFYGLFSFISFIYKDKEV